MNSLSASEIKITYIFHNCFVLETHTAGIKRVIVFDLPCTDMIVPQSREILKNKISNNDVLMFFSHSHQDHFSKEFVDLLDLADMGKVIFSHDVMKKHRSFIENRLNNDNFITVLPEKEYNFAGLHIKTLKSNDMGVAFAIFFDKVRIFYSGDLAKWSWPKGDPKVVKEDEAVFARAIEKMKEWNINTVFADTDPRLENFTGAGDILLQVVPEYFIPMHSFGNHEAIERFIEEFQKNNPENPSSVFKYSGSGNSFKIKF